MVVVLHRLVLQITGGQGERDRESEPQAEAAEAVDAFNTEGTERTMILVFMVVHVRALHWV